MNVSPPTPIARVAPLTLTRAIRGPFDYRLRADQEVVVGSVLRVRFGHSRMLGVVVGLAERSEVAPERLAEPDAVLPVAVPEDLVALAEWIACEYCSTTARALSLMLAPGAATGMQARALLVAQLTDAGHVALHDGESLTARQRQALDALQRDGAMVAAQLGTAVLRRLESKGLVALRRQAYRRRPARHVVGEASATAPPLTSAQRSALDAVLAALPARRGRFLLHGVTGSGKTEVYLRAVEAALAAGRCAIVLVPEIALTPQAMARFEARFGERVAVLHSALGRGERHDEWLRLARGEARVCIGPRSAVFAPLADIGLVIVDEEHDSSYKHEGDPRYDARHVAERRAREHGAVLLLGSATPRPESALSTATLRLRERVDGRSLPSVEILDMRGRHHSLHPRTLMALADVRRSGAKAIVLLNRRGWSNFLSCRSCGLVWMCPNCEVALVLHRAGAGGRPYVACHHCGHREPVPSRCSACASVTVARHGSGTQRIEHELREALGAQGFPILRLDADCTGRHVRARTLERFHAAEAGLLVGTQMIAKGHDFPDVSLGVVIDADQTLRFPDFRAEERTFALVTQLAGRAGRGGRREDAGRVLVQTLAPDARAIQLAARHDSDGFLAGELERRRALRYPPFSSLIRIVCSAPGVLEGRPAASERGAAGRAVPAGAAFMADAAAAAGEVAALLKTQIDPPGAVVLGPAPLFALRGRARSQLVVKATDRAAAISAVGKAVDGLPRTLRTREVSVSVDVDPQ